MTAAEPPWAHLVFVAPEIPTNTGATIRLAAITGVHLHLVRPLGFLMTDARLRRAGLDYHDLAHVTVHDDLSAALGACGGGRVYAFTSRGAMVHTEVAWRRGDVLVFGAESVGLSEAVLADPRVTATVRLPMRPGLRSLNLATSAGVAIYEAWRQVGFDGAP